MGNNPNSVRGKIFLKPFIHKGLEDLSFYYMKTLTDQLPI